MLIGDVIREERQKAGLTQLEFARTLGVGKAVVSRWEANTRLPGNAILLKIADVLRISYKILIDLKREGPRPEPSDPVAGRLAGLVGELADPMSIRLIELFRGLNRQQRQNVLDLVEMAAKIAREGDKPGNPVHQPAAA